MPKFNQNLQSNNFTLQEILNTINELPEAGGIELLALQNKSASSGGNIESRMIEVESQFSVNPVYYITSSYELAELQDGTAAALDGMVFYHGVYRLVPISGDYTYHSISSF